jgi:hypothetical protein
MASPIFIIILLLQSKQIVHKFINKSIRIYFPHQHPVLLTACRGERDTERVIADAATVVDALHLVESDRETIAFSDETHEGVTTRLT